MDLRHGFLFFRTTAPTQTVDIRPRSPADLSGSFRQERLEQLGGWSGGDLFVPLPEGITDGASFADRVEYSTRPHLRALVILMCVLLLSVVRIGRQLVVLPMMLLMFGGTSGIWCTPRELILSLGPVPLCATSRSQWRQRRIPYDAIESMTIVSKRIHACGLFLRLFARPWQPLGFAYGLTLGRQHIDLHLRDDHDGGAGKLRSFWPQRMLVSADDAATVMAFVEFRRQHGAAAILPNDLALAHPQALSVAPMVLCDTCGLSDMVFCDICNLVLPQSSRTSSHSEPHWQAQDAPSLWHDATPPSPVSMGKVQ